MIRRRRIVKFETRKITVVRAATETINLWCELCGATVEMVTPESAAEILVTNPRAIYRQAETGNLHFVEASSGELLICRESLRPHECPPELEQRAKRPIDLTRS